MGLVILHVELPGLHLDLGGIVSWDSWSRWHDKVLLMDGIDKVSGVLGEGTSCILLDSLGCLDVLVCIAIWVQVIDT